MLGMEFNRTGDLYLAMSSLDPETAGLGEQVGSSISAYPLALIGLDRFRWRAPTLE